MNPCDNTPNLVDLIHVKFISCSCNSSVLPKSAEGRRDPAASPAASPGSKDSESVPHLLYPVDTQGRSEVKDHTWEVCVVQACKR